MLFLSSRLLFTGYSVFIPCVPLAFARLGLHEIACSDGRNRMKIVEDDYLLLLLAPKHCMLPNRGRIEVSDDLFPSLVSKRSISHAHHANAGVAQPRLIQEDVRLVMIEIAVQKSFSAHWPNAPLGS